MTTKTKLSKKIKISDRIRKPDKLDVQEQNYRVAQNVKAYPYERASVMDLLFNDKPSNPGRFSSKDAITGKRNRQGTKVQMNTASTEKLRKQASGYNVGTGKKEDWSHKGEFFLNDRKKEQEHQVRRAHFDRRTKLQRDEYKYSPEYLKELEAQADSKRDERLAKVDKRFKRIREAGEELRRREKGVRRIVVTEKDGSTYDASAPINSDRDPLRGTTVKRKQGKAVYRGKKGTPKVVSISKKYS